MDISFTYEKSLFPTAQYYEIFRRKYLIEKGQKQIFFTYQFRKLSYRCYIVGSDQIWNPDITFGLREVYFGAFKSKNKKKVFAYAASLGERNFQGSMIMSLHNYYVLWMLFLLGKKKQCHI